MRITLTTLFALFPLAAAAGGHGTFYVCEAAGLQSFEIEVAARDCQIGSAKARKTGEAPDVCDFGSGALGKVTIAGTGAATIEANGKTFNGTCRPR